MNELLDQLKAAINELGAWTQHDRNECPVRYDAEAVCRCGLSMTLHQIDKTIADLAELEESRKMDAWGR